MRGFFALSLLSAALGASAALTESSLKTHVDVLALDSSFNPIEAAYWTDYVHHRRTPFAVSPDGKTAYLAYLDASGSDVHVTELDPTTFEATGTTVTVSGGQEAGGLVAHNDGFALLTNEAMPSGTTNAPPSDTPVPVLHRYTNGKQTWKTWLGGPGVHSSDGLSASPDLNGDLVYSESAGLYGAYFVVTDYSGDASGHYGDSIEYVADNGTLVIISGASSSWGCSHNTGIAFEAADEPPYASICAEDQGAIWLNTKTQGMTNDGVKISNENTTNGASGEAMGGMGGSYSGLARFADSTRYIFTWVSRGAVDVTENTWMGDGYTHVSNRTNPRNVALALFTDKYTKVGKQATSTVGAEDGDSQVTWVTSGSNDCSNAHVATFGNSSALITWEEISDPLCEYIAMGCRGQFAGTYFQQVDSDGNKVGDAFKSTDVYVSGDMVTMSDGRICWPYVNMDWDLSEVVWSADSSKYTKKMSFACIGGSDSSNSTTTASATAKASTSASVAIVSSASAAVTHVAAGAASASVETVSETPVAPSSVAAVAAEATSAVVSAQVPSWTVGGESRPSTFQTQVQVPTQAAQAGSNWGINKGFGQGFGQESGQGEEEHEGHCQF
ncbi:hypothetical protein AtubIFM55763_009013 [Aspergillus tubingensis]|uniref:Uncharacterized protein n=1 Tax=Aspergillus tubingensis TaxID=5068 RepID=A0A8H3SRG9_ASPTU|nr:aldo/keto reductase family protein [Aspergillus tubingensis]GFN13615.1 aldo/keto reductase family protein [Aspergillus tubingensis]GLA77129.1 hypothetical protein AtubIFM55763_009013 [Aspergillus tubingensis]GLA89460.1 hypothetical protein AtubIFM56815_003939 [Aspergillus tubingensis]